MWPEGLWALAVGGPHEGQGGAGTEVSLSGSLDSSRAAFGEIPLHQLETHRKPRQPSSAFHSSQAHFCGLKLPQSQE